MNIIYLHGLSSSGNARTAQRLKQLYPGDNVIAPDIPLDPAEALPYLKEVVARCDPDDTVVIGTSMGGGYAQQMTGCKRILVNPSFHVSQKLRDNLGQTLPFFSPRRDGATEFIVTRQLCDAFKEMESRQFDAPKDADNVYALFGTQDDVVDCREEYLEHYRDYGTFEGGHRLTEKAITHELADALERMRHRPAMKVTQSRILPWD